MNHRPDSAQVIATIGSLAGFVAANYDRLLAGACAAVGISYTIWKWRREAKSDTRRRR